jgi:hypothetical protein
MRVLQTVSQHRRGLCSQVTEPSNSSAGAAPATCGNLSSRSGWSPPQTPTAASVGTHAAAVHAREPLASLALALVNRTRGSADVAPACRAAQTANVGPTLPKSRTRNSSPSPLQPTSKTPGNPSSLLSLRKRRRKGMVSPRLAAGSWTKHTADSRITKTPVRRRTPCRDGRRQEHATIQVASPSAARMSTQREAPSSSGTGNQERLDL